MRWIMRCIAKETRTPNDNIGVTIKYNTMDKLYIHNGEYYTRDAYFTLMFGSEFMERNDKGTLKEYEE